MTQRFIKVSMTPGNIELCEQGRKTATSRTYQLGQAGDHFRLSGLHTKEYVLLSVERMALGEVARNHHKEEGFDSITEFAKIWISLHPGGFIPYHDIYFHRFEKYEKV